MEQSPFKDALLRKRGEILAATSGVNKPLTTSAETNTRQGDLGIRRAVTTKSTFNSN